MTVANREDLTKCVAERKEEIARKRSNRGSGWPKSSGSDAGWQSDGWKSDSWRSHSGSDAGSATSWKSGSVSARRSHGGTWNQDSEDWNS